MLCVENKFHHDFQKFAAIRLNLTQGLDEIMLL